MLGVSCMLKIILIALLARLGSKTATLAVSKILNAIKILVLLHLSYNPPDENQNSLSVQQGLIRWTKVVVKNKSRRAEALTQNGSGPYILNGAKSSGRFCSSASSTGSPRREPG